MLASVLVTSLFPLTSQRRNFRLWIDLREVYWSRFEVATRPIASLIERMLSTHQKISLNVHEYCDDGHRVPCNFWRISVKRQRRFIAEKESQIWDIQPEI